MYIGGLQLQFTDEGEGGVDERVGGVEKIPTVWLANSDTLQPRMDLKISQFIRPSELITMNFQMAAHEEVHQNWVILVAERPMVRNF